MFTHPRQVAKAYPDKPAFIMQGHSSTTLGYADLVRRADQLSAFMASLNVKEGDTIAILLTNGAPFVEICWAAINSGLHYAAVSTHLNRPDASYILENSGATLLFTTWMEIEHVGLTPADLENLTVVIVEGDAGDHIKYNDVMDFEPASPQLRKRGASMLYSSGTTGRPKGVRSELGPAPDIPPERHQLLTEKLHFNQDMTFLNPGPFYHAGPMRMMISAQRVGGTVIGFSSFDPELVLSAIDKYSATHGFCVPTMFHRMLAVPNDIKKRFDLNSLEAVIHGAAPCPMAIKEAMIDWWGPVLFEVYGGTESVGQTSISSTEWLKHKGSVGRAGPDTKIMIINSEGSEAKPLEQGLIYMKNDRTFSYHDDPDKTRSAKRDDGFTTLGDIGYLDADGYLFLTDRAAHMIISGGVNIYPQEAEAVLINHPHIEDVAVIGVPHNDMGEEAKAIIVLKDGIQGSEQLANDIINFCREQLSRIKCPRSIDFTDSLPRNEAGKVLKREIRRPYWPD